jgi:hypothetical protein
MLCPRDSLRKSRPGKKSFPPQTAISFRANLHRLLFTIVAARQSFACYQAESLTTGESLQFDEVSLCLRSLACLLFQFRCIELSFELDSQELMKTGTL